ncbi:MAG TPA: CPBP family intramembrane glutamic endopeptidase [candidate division Zixibacteria bacterium]|nr:CPBP family intramembrane glutamic endopeptidase [candidate division Zixibacteria bacterium]
MNAHHRLVLYMLLALLLTCAVSPWMAAGADWFLRDSADRYPFSRIFNRTFMVSGFVLFVAGRKFLRVGGLAGIGLERRPGAAAEIATGWSLATGSVAVLVAGLVAFGIFTPFFRLAPGESVRRVADALASGFFAGSLEEVFFRGILFKGLLASGKTARAFVLANLFYALIHFVKPGERYFLDRPDPWAGFRHLAYTFSPFLDPAELLPGAVGLFLIGLVLSYAFLRSGALYLSIGLHAGWVFGLKIIRVFGDYRRDDLGWLFGETDPKLVSGVAAWIGIALVGAAVHYLTRPGAIDRHARGGA